MSTCHKALALWLHPPFMREWDDAFTLTLSRRERGLVARPLTERIGYSEEAGASVERLHERGVGALSAAST